MKRQLFLLINVFAMAVFGLILIQFQTTVWYHFWYPIAGHIPSPTLWFLPVIYAAIYRSSFEGLVLTYILGIAAASFTVKDVTLLLSVLLVLYMTMQIFKTRIYWEGYRYFALVSIVGLFGYHFLDISFHILTDKGHWISIQPLERAISWILTGLFSFPIYRILVAMDRMTEKDRYSAPGSHAI